jgi:hypothetical protein
MPLAQLALLVAALFAGASIYISVAEHPARMKLDDQAALAQWKTSHGRGRLVQGILALIGGLLGLWVWWHSLNMLWLIGALLLLANWPFTLLAIMPVNRRLESMSAGPETRALLERWGRFHLIRADLGGSAALVMLIAQHWRI